jgi:hypothetical protein
MPPIRWARRYTISTSHLGNGSIREQKEGLKPVEIIAIEKRVQFFVHGGHRTRELLHAKKTLKFATKLMKLPVHRR